MVKIFACLTHVSIKNEIQRDYHEKTTSFGEVSEKLPSKITYKICNEKIHDALRNQNP